MFTIDTTRWDAIESLPLQRGMGDLKAGLCAIARIVYASTGRVSDLAGADCIAPTIRAYMTVLNDYLPRELRQRLGTLELARQVIAADTSREAEQRRAYLCADTAVRVFAVGALRAADLPNEAGKLAALAPITDQNSAYAAVADADAAAEAAYYAARVARSAAAYAARYAATHVTRYTADAAADAAASAAAVACAARAARNADAARCASYLAARSAATVADAAAYAARSAADAAADAAAAAAAWEPAFELLTALLAPSSTQTAL